MQAVIPMAGRGSRFVKAGYKIPKYMIKVKQKTLFEYSVQSLPNSIIDKYIFVVLEDHILKYNLIDFIYEKMKPYDKKEILIVKLKEVTRGQAETVFMARDVIDKTDDLIIYNIDTYFVSSTLEEKLVSKHLKRDGVIGAFKLNVIEDKWSFAEVDDNDNVIRTTEKEVISNIALTGFYHFTKASDFLDVAEEKIRKNELYKGEFYVAPLYNDLIKLGKKFVLDFVDKIIPLGTPEDLRRAEYEL